MIQFNREAGISKKYDGTLDYGIEMYDNLPYQRNSDVCNSSTVALYSGHIIKYYLCNNEEDAYPINNRDDEIQAILRHAREEAEKRQTEDTKPEVIGDPSEITDEQIQALTTDQSSDNDGAGAEPADTQEVVNLDDIEDW